MAFKRKRSNQKGCPAKRRKITYGRRRKPFPTFYKRYVRSFKRYGPRGRNKMIRKVGWGNEPMSRLLKIKNLTETTLSWDFFSPGSTTSQPVRIQVGHQNWIPNPTNLTVKEALFDSYVSKNYSNLHTSIPIGVLCTNTRQTAPAQVTTGGTAPPATTTATKSTN